MFSVVVSLQNLHDMQKNMGDTSKLSKLENSLFVSDKMLWIRWGFKVRVTRLRFFEMLAVVYLPFLP